MDASLQAQPAGAAELDYLLVQPGAPAQAGRAAATLLPAPSGAGAEVVALLPAASVSWHAVQLPKGVGLSSPRLRAVLEGLLEDRLLDEPGQLHLASFARNGSTGEVWVAACDREWLQRWCSLLEAAQRPVDRIVPEAVPQDSGPALLQVLGDADEPQAWLCDRDGVWCGPLSALTALASTRPDAMDALDVRSEPQTAAAAEHALQRPVRVASAAQRRAEAVEAASDWNLAQGEFDASGGRRALRHAGQRAAQALVSPQWRAARWGAVALLLAHLVGLNAWAVHEQRALADKRAAVQQVLTRSFPQVKVVVDAPLQMERELAALRRSSGAAAAADLEALLGALTAPSGSGATAASASASSAASPTPSQIEFAQAELRLRGMALQGADVQAVRDRAKAIGATVDVQGDVLVLRRQEAR
ncbi:MAG: type II secretion system protein GspL [Burkholderiaceae bacterium]